MTVARRLESRIRTLNLFVTFIRQLALTYKFLNNLVLAFPKCSPKSRMILKAQKRQITFLKIQKLGVFCDYLL